MVCIIVQVPPPELDMFGRVVSVAPADQFAGRCGSALALGAMAPLLGDHVTQLFTFFVTQSLNDRHETVRADMLTAAVSVIDHHGKVCQLNVTHSHAHTHRHTHTHTHTRLVAHCSGLLC